MDWDELKRDIHNQKVCSNPKSRDLKAFKDQIKKCGSGLSVTKVGMNVKSRDEDYFSILTTLIFKAPALRNDHVGQTNTIRDGGSTAPYSI